VLERVDDDDDDDDIDESDDIMTVMMTMMIWIVTLCRLIGRYQHFRETYYLHLQS
jgi:hypothetical protein